MDGVQSSAISTTRLAGPHCFSLPPGTGPAADKSAQPIPPETILEPKQQRQWAFALRRLSRLEQLIELDAPDVVLRTEWRLVSAAFSSLDTTEATASEAAIA